MLSGLSSPKGDKAVCGNFIFGLSFAKERSLVESFVFSSRNPLDFELVAVLAQTLIRGGNQEVLAISIFENKVSLLHPV